MGAKHTEQADDLGAVPGTMVRSLAAGDRSLTDNCRDNAVSRYEFGRIIELMREIAEILKRRRVFPDLLFAEGSGGVPIVPDSIYADLFDEFREVFASSRSYQTSLSPREIWVVDTKSEDPALFCARPQRSDAARDFLGAVLARIVEKFGACGQAARKVAPAEAGEYARGRAAELPRQSALRVHSGAAATVSPVAEMPGKIPHSGRFTVRIDAPVANWLRQRARAVSPKGVSLNKMCSSIIESIVAEEFEGLSDLAAGRDAETPVGTQVIDRIADLRRKHLLVGDAPGTELEDQFPVVFSKNVTYSLRALQARLAELSNGQRTSIANLLRYLLLTYYDRHAVAVAHSNASSLDRIGYQHIASDNMVRRAQRVIGGRRSD